MSSSGPPFQQITFKDVQPKGKWAPWTAPYEDGPSAYAPVYAGQDQQKTINAAYLPPPVAPAKCTLPGAAVGYSAIP